MYAPPHLHTGGGVRRRLQKCVYFWLVCFFVWLCVSVCLFLCLIVCVCWFVCFFVWLCVCVSVGLFLCLIVCVCWFPVCWFVCFCVWLRVSVGSGFPVCWLVYFYVWMCVTVGLWVFVCFVFCFVFLSDCLFAYFAVPNSPYGLCGRKVTSNCCAESFFLRLSDPVHWWLNDPTFGPQVAPQVPQPLGSSLPKKLWHLH